MKTAQIACERAKGRRINKETVKCGEVGRNRRVPNMAQMIYVSPVPLPELSICACFMLAGLQYMTDFLCSLKTPPT